MLECIVVVFIFMVIDEILLEIVFVKFGLVFLLFFVNNLIVVVVYLCKVIKSVFFIYGFKFEEIVKDV